MALNKTESSRSWGSRAVDSKALAVAVILVITVLAYANSVNNGFVADDNGFVKHNLSIRALGNIPGFFFNSSKTMAAYDPQWGMILYRPLRTLSYAIDYRLFGGWAPGFHMTSLLLYLLSIVTVYFLAEALFSSAAVSFLAAFFFALHPVHVEAVSWISSRADLIGLIFANLSLLCYFKYRNGRPPYWLALSLVLSFVSYLGKETMVFFPALIILYDLSRERKVADAIKSSWASWLLFSAACLGYLVFRFQMTGRMSTIQGWWGGTAYSNFLMMLKAAALYLKILLYPLKLSLHYVIMPVYSLSDIWVLASALALLAMLGLTVFFWSRNRKVFFLLAWFFMGLVPIANIIPNSFSMMAERYIFAPSTGLIIAAALGITGLRGRIKGNKASAQVLTGALAALLIAFFVIIVMRNPVYKDEFSFYSAAVKDSPYSSPSLKSLADQYANRKDHVKALEYYDKALALTPDFPEGLMAKASVLAELGNFNEAAAIGQRAVKLKPKDAQMRFILGEVYRLGGDMGAAAGEWQKAIEIYPQYAEAYNNLGAHYQVIGDNQKAIEMYGRSIAINPLYPETYYNMALVYEASGDRQKAREYYLNFIRLAGPDLKDIVEDVKKRL